jgi:HAD superfamily phosphoserine phosphatase-like hydrolase
MKKLIFFDLDGTLTPTNSWHFFNLFFGMSEAEDAVMFDWYKRGLLSYSAWEEMISKIIKEKNICTKDKVDEFVGSIIPRPEAKDLIDGCKEAGYTTVILSGTMMQIAESVRARLGMDLSYTTSEILFREDGAFDYIKNDSDEAPAKLRIFDRVCAEYGVDPTETIMVGDSGNDIEVFKRTKKGIQIGTYEPLKEYAWKHVDNLSEVKESL